MLLWIRVYRSSDILSMFIAFITQLLILIFKMLPSISMIVILVSSAIFIMSFTCHQSLPLFLVVFCDRVLFSHLAPCWIVKTFRVLDIVLNCQNGILPLLFIGFNWKSSSNSLQLPLLHEATLFLWSIGHVCPHNLSSIRNTKFSVLIFYTS